MGVQISEWNWHYRVGFDTSLQRKVRQVEQELKNERLKHQVSRHLELFSDFISVDALIEAIRERPEKADSYIDEAMQKQILFCPAFACTRWPTNSTEMPDMSVSSFKRLSRIIEESRGSDFINLNKSYFAAVFTESQVAGLVSDGQRFTRDKKNEVVPCRKSNARDHASKYQLEAHLKGIEKAAKALYPTSTYTSAPDYSCRISSEINCWAEYWPRQLTGKQNILLLGLELLKSDEDVIASTLVHEIAGHAFFYNIVERREIQLIDQGAHCLIEGWATWCEWNCDYLDLELRRQLRSDGCHQLDFIFEESQDKITSAISLFCSLKGYSEEVTKATILTFFQYPCFSHSYILGALGLEKIIKNKSLEEFWYELEGAQAGNYLSI